MHMRQGERYITLITAGCQDMNLGPAFAMKQTHIDSAYSRTEVMDALPYIQSIATGSARQHIADIIDDEASMLVSTQIIRSSRPIGYIIISYIIICMKEI